MFEEYVTNDESMEIAETLNLLTIIVTAVNVVFPHHTFEQGVVAIVKEYASIPEIIQKPFLVAKNRWRKALLMHGDVILLR